MTPTVPGFLIVRMRRYEDAKQSRFWEIAVLGDTIHTRAGKQGRDGRVSQSQAPGRAPKQAQSKIKQKLKEGFTLAWSAPSITHEAARLQDAIFEGAEEDAPYLVYADWLQGQGDPRGELISIHHQQSQGESKVARLETRLRRKHPELGLPERFVAQLKKRKIKARPPSAYATAQWRLGFLDSAHVAIRDQGERFTLRELLLELLLHPSTRFLRTLSLGTMGTAKKHDYRSTLETLSIACPPGLRSLSVGDLEPQVCPLGSVRLGSIDALCRAAPQLRKLSLRGESLQLSDAQAPRLLHLKLSLECWDPLAELSPQALPSLTQLELDAQYGALTGSLLGALLKASVAPKLQTLKLHHLGHAGALLTQLESIPGCEKLEVVLVDSDLDPASPTVARWNGRLKLERPQGEVPITEAMLYGPNGTQPQLISRAHRLASSLKWIKRGRWGNTLWGDIDEGWERYSAYVRTSLTGLEASCSCWSERDRCKHIIALMIAQQEGLLKEAKVPAGLIAEADSDRHQLY